MSSTKHVALTNTPKASFALAYNETISKESAFELLTLRLRNQSSKTNTYVTYGTLGIMTAFLRGALSYGFFVCEADDIVLALTKTTFIVMKLFW